MTTENAAAQETTEQIEARLKQESIDSGDFHEPTDDDELVAPGTQEVIKAEISAETLAAIAGTTEEKPKMIPHARFNEVNEEAKTHRARVLELEEQLARMKGSTAAEQPKTEEAPKGYDFDAAEEAFAAAILDGDTGKAKSLRAEIRAQERADATKEAEAVADRRHQTNKAQDDAVRTKLEFETSLAKAYAEFPFLNAESDSANADAIDEALAMTAFYKSKGKSASEALSAAVAKVGPRYVPEAETKPLAEAKPDLKKGAERASQIPAKTAGLGARAPVLDIRKMTGADIKKLSKEEDALLSGNEL